MPGSDRVTEVLAALRANGTRVTSSRRAVVAALLESSGHLSANDLNDLVSEAHPEVHQSTVYRTLETLVELGVVEHIHVAHGPAVYHLAEDHHLHLVCGRCGDVLDAPPALLSDAAKEVADRYGFRLAVGHVALTGRCRECQAQDLKSELEQTS